MNDRVRKMLNYADINHDGKVDIEDAVKAWEYVDAQVKPHGWGWSVCLFVSAFMAGYFLGKLFA